MTIWSENNEEPQIIALSVQKCNYLIAFVITEAMKPI